MKRPEATWTPMWYGFRMQSEYPGGKRNVSHHIFPSTTRRHGARVGTIPSEYLHIRVPTDDTLTTTFYVKANIKPEGPYKTTCRGMQQTQPGVYQRVKTNGGGSNRATRTVPPRKVRGRSTTVRANSWEPPTRASLCGASWFSKGSGRPPTVPILTASSVERSMVN
jgi:hypothetical protein